MKILGVTCFLCAFAVLFPPYGFHNFEQFAFIFSESVPLKDYSNLKAQILWHILGAEIAAILFAGIGLHFIIKNKS